MTRQELITSQEYILTTIQDDIANELTKSFGPVTTGPRTAAQIHELAGKHDINVAELYLALRGDYNGKLSDLVAIFRAIGKRVVISFEDINTDPQR